MKKVCTIVPWMVALLNLNTNKNCEAFEIEWLTEKEKEDVANNKVHQICSKVFAQKSNHDRHITKWHCPDSNAFDECIEPIADEHILSMVFPADPVAPEVVDAIPTSIPEEDNKDIVQSNQQSTGQDDKNLHTRKKQWLLHESH